MGLLVIYLTMGWMPTLLREGGLSIERAATITGLFQIGGTVGRDRGRLGHGPT